MRRREFIALAGAAAAFPRIALAQSGNVPRIAYLSMPQLVQWNEAFQQGLADRGYSVGKTVTVEFFTAPTIDDLPALAAKAVATRPDVITTSGSAAALAAKAATSTIPIVFTNVADPIAIGLIPSLAHPGGNITGSTILAPDLAGKQLQVLKDIAPTMRRVALLNVPVDPSAGPILSQARTAAAMLSLEAVVFDFSAGQDITTQFERVAAAGVQGVFVPANAYLSANRDTLFDLLVAAKLPAVSFGPTLGAAHPTTGVLGYGPSVSGEIRRAAALVVAILKGAKAGELTVQQPSIFELTLNLAAAKAMGLKVPDAIFAQATLVLE